MTLEDAAIANGWACRGERGQLVWRADEVHPGEVWDAAVAAERERWMAACRTVAESADAAGRPGVQTVAQVRRLAMDGKA